MRGRTVLLLSRYKGSNYMIDYQSMDSMIARVIGVDIAMKTNDMGFRIQDNLDYVAVVAANRGTATACPESIIEL